jgi:hypothetical protein
VRALRDAGISETWMGRYIEAEVHLTQALDEATGLTPDYRYPMLFWLADLNMRRGTLEQSREWLMRIDRMEEWCRGELRDWLRFDYTANLRDQIERHLAKRERQRRSGR